MTLPLLIVGGRPDQPPPGPDTLIIDGEKTIGIAAVRKMERFLQRRPYQDKLTTAVIPAADKLTLPAQQALLKTLEEPPPRSRIILACLNPSRLLPTIISRCLVRPALEVQTVPAVRLEPPPPAASANAAAAKTFVIGQLRFLHDQLRRRPETVNLQLIKALHRALIALNANVNPKLTLDVLALYY